MQAPAAEKDLGGDGGEKKVSLGIFVDAAPTGLVVTGLRREGWCSAVGMVGTLAQLNLTAKPLHTTTEHAHSIVQTLRVTQPAALPGAWGRGVPRSTHMNKHTI